MARRVQGARRRVGWEIGPKTGTTGAEQSATASGSLLATIGSGATTDGLTLVRTRGELLIRLSVADAVGSGYQGAFGIGVVTAAAFTAGAASVPTPITEDSWDGWLYHTYFQVLAQSTTLSDGTNALSAVFRQTVDSKAMRKLRLDDVVFAAFEFTETGTSTLSMNFNSRLLLKLP